MLDIREEPTVQRAVDEACLRWPRAPEAWEAMTWALARDPYGAGSPLTESGEARLMVFFGARSLGMPSARLVYVVEPTCVVVREAQFFDSDHAQAGHA